MDQDNTIEQTNSEATREILSSSGYSEKAVEYFIKKPYMGSLCEADQISEMTGSCGDTMKISLKMKDGIITDARYQVLGCPGAVAAAMAAVDLIKGKSLDNARHLGDSDIFRLLAEIPEQKHHCIQLAVKTLHKALDEYKNEDRPLS